MRGRTTPTSFIASAKAGLRLNCVGGRAASGRADVPCTPTVLVSRMKSNHTIVAEEYWSLCGDVLLAVVRPRCRIDVRFVNCEMPPYRNP